MQQLRLVCLEPTHDQSPNLNPRGKLSFSFQETLSVIKKKNAGKITGNSCTLKAYMQDISFAYIFVFAYNLPHTASEELFP